MRKLVIAGLVGATGGALAPPSKVWSTSRCERVLLEFYRGPHAARLSTGNGHHFGLGQAICVGSGGPHACRWTAGHRSRLYSEFRVFTRSPLNGGVVRSWTLATHAGHGFVPVAHRAVPFVPDFYMSSTTLLASDATPARFHSIVAPIAARLTQQANASGCTGGG